MPPIASARLPNLHSKFGNSGIAGLKDFLLQDCLLDYTIIVYLKDFLLQDCLLDYTIIVYVCK